MIKKLRIKFIIINMLFVSIVLLIVFIAICIFNYQQYYNETAMALRRAIDTRQDAGPPKFEIGGRPPKEGQHFVVTPVFCVILDEQGGGERIVVTLQENVSVSEAVIVDAVNAATEAGEKEGIIKSLNLRFLVEETKNGRKIAFADRSNEISSMRQLLFSSLIIGVASLFAFFLISLFLSKWALRPVERAWKQQRQFVADASHELKTPLTIILANMGILLGHKKDTVENQSKWVENTQDEAMRMKGLVDDMLYLAKSDAAETPVVFSRINLSDILWNSVLTFEAVAYEKGVPIETHIDSDIYVLGDEGKLKQLSAILLDNGCKYTEERGTVTISLYKEQDRVFLKVHNTGSHISDDEKEHIFERFYRVDKSRDRRQGGYGLGLSIAKSIVELHNGKIAVESGERKGTTFTVQLKS